MSSASCALIEADWLCGFQCPAASTYYKNGSAHSDEEEGFHRTQGPGQSSFAETGASHERRLTAVGSPAEERMIRKKEVEEGKRGVQKESE